MPSVTRRTSSGRLRREAVEQRVFDAVERLLADGESFTSLGVQRIADEAQIARSTFYVHFPDKSTLLMRLTESATRDMFPRPEEWVGGADASGLDALTRTTERMLSHYRSHADALAALAEVAAYDTDVAEFWRVRVDRFAEVLRARLESDRRAGRLPADLDCDVTARLIAWGTERIVSDHMANDDGRGDERLAVSLARAMWAAMHAAG
jgi:AcrR family transcriptional regulator